MKLLDHVRLIKDVEGQEHIPIEVAILVAFYFIGTSSCPDCRNAKRTCYYCQLVINLIDKSWVLCVILVGNFVSMYNELHIQEASYSNVN